jgi:hypothetical protein
LQFSNDFSSKSNGTAKASVNGNGIANKIFDHTDLKYETNSTGMAILFTKSMIIK